MGGLQIIGTQLLINQLSAGLVSTSSKGILWSVRIFLLFFLSLPKHNSFPMAAKSDTKKLKSPEIEVIWKDNVPEAVYFDRNGYKIVAKVENGQFILTRYGWGEGEESIVVSPNNTVKLKESLKVKHSDTLIKTLGKRFALKEPHNSFVKILTSLERRGIPYERK